MSSTRSSEVLPGERIGRYTVVRRLAAGGMAEVYLARQEGLKGFAKLVVLKRVLPGLEQTEKFVAMFLDEGRLAGRLAHPCIAQTFELGEHEGAFHLVMEYVPGESLYRLVKRAQLDARPIPAGSVIRIVLQVLEGLAYAHELKGDRGEWLKVVHRDVSPTNVIVSYHGAVKLLDFGIARAASNEHHTGIGTVKGKGGYMSPEQALALPVDQRTDLYAVGALLYLLTTGAGPFEGQPDVFTMMQAAIEGKFPRPSERNRDLDPRLEQIILKAMSRRSEDRYPTAGEMLAELEEYAAAQRIFPSSRELTTYLRQLFPERAELARSYDQALDEAVVDKLAESFKEIGSGEILMTPTRLARRPLPPRPEEPPAPSPAPAPKAVKPLKPAGEAKSEKPSSRTHTQTLPILPALPLPPDPRPAAEPEPVDLGGYAGAVPELARAPSERPTLGERVVFNPVDPDERPARAGLSRLVPPKEVSVPARTVSADQEVTGPSLALRKEETLVEAPPVGGPSMTDLSKVGHLGGNPWAFLVAGLGAVLLGAALIWALSGG